MSTVILIPCRRHRSLPFAFVLMSNSQHMAIPMGAGFTGCSSRKPVPVGEGGNSQQCLATPSPLLPRGCITNQYSCGRYPIMGLVLSSDGTPRGVTGKRDPRNGLHMNSHVGGPQGCPGEVSAGCSLKSCSAISSPLPPPRGLQAWGPLKGVLYPSRRNNQCWLFSRDSQGWNSQCWLFLRGLGGLQGVMYPREGYSAGCSLPECSKVYREYNTPSEGTASAGCSSWDVPSQAVEGWTRLPRPGLKTHPCPALGLAPHNPQSLGPSGQP